MNIQRLIAVKAVILCNQAKFNYRYFQDTHYTIQKDPINDCKSVGCVAGFTTALFFPEKYRPGKVSATARELLDLTYEEAEWLFYPWNFGKSQSAKDYDVNAAIDRLDWLIGGHDWILYPGNKWMDTLPTEVISCLKKRQEQRNTK